MFSRGFSLAEILIAITLMGLIILAVASVDITSRRFFGTSKDEVWIQDEAKIAMQHITSRVQRGVGNMGRPGAMDDNPNDSDVQSSRGFYILSGVYTDFDNPGLLTDSGSRLWVKIDTNANGKFDSGIDQIVEYQEVNNSIRFYPDVTDRANYESLADGIVEKAIFSFVHNVDPELAIPNRVDVEIQVLREPGKDPGLNNPQTTLTSSIILKAMSTR